MSSYWNTFRGLWLLTWRSRLSWRRWPAQLFAVFFVPLMTVFTISQGNYKGYYTWTVNIYFLLLIPLYCLLNCGAIIRDEIQSDTLRFLITRPVKRPVLFLLKFAAQIIVIEATLLVTGLLLLAAGAWHRVDDLGTFAGWFLMAQFLGVLAYGSLSALFGLLSPRYWLFGVIYGFVVEIGIGLIPINIHNISISRHLRTLLAQEKFFQGDQYGWTPDGPLFSVFMLLAGTVLFLGLGAALFAWREYHAGTEMQK